MTLYCVLSSVFSKMFSGICKKCGPSIDLDPMVHDRRYKVKDTLILMKILKY